MEMINSQVKAGLNTEPYPWISLDYGYGTSRQVHYLWHYCKERKKSFGGRFVSEMKSGENPESELLSGWSLEFGPCMCRHQV